MKIDKELLDPWHTAAPVWGSGLSNRASLCYPLTNRMHACTHARMASKPTRVAKGKSSFADTALKKEPLQVRIPEPLAKFIERGEFSLCSRGRSGRRSGRRGPELGDAEYLIDRERQHAEHEVAFDLDRAAHAHGPCAEFILQSGVDAFGQGAKIKNDVVRIGHMDEFHALDFFGPFGLGFVLGAKVAIDDRRMAERLAVVMDGGGVVGRIH